METRMVVGLGNPGIRYVKTRHNIGFDVVDALAETFGVKVDQKKFGACFGMTERNEKKLILLKPWQYMNNSGQAVATALGFYKLAPADLMVVLDDMALEPGRLRVRASGSAGGHNGLSDIIAKLGTSQFARCRVGIGRSPDRTDVDHVLGRPVGPEREVLEEAVGLARQAVLCWLDDGVDRAMTRFNG